MPNAPLPLDESRRLLALESLHLLDTLPEERFDRITRIAARVLGAPMALVGLVDERRLWCKSEHGVLLGEVARDESFCAHTVLDEPPLVVPDSTCDARFTQSLLVTGKPHIRAYAGVPVHAGDGQRVGTLCVMDTVARTFPPDDLDALRDLAGMVDRELRQIAINPVDELTSLASRQGLLLVGRHVLLHCRRYSLPATVVTIDLTDFKSINERHGFHVGNTVLRGFGQLLKACFRDADVVARAGGDEFAVLCVGASLRQVAFSMDRLRREYSGTELARSQPMLFWHLGIAEYDPCTEPHIEDLLLRAFEQMRGTQPGQQRVIVAN